MVLTLVRENGKPLILCIDCFPLYAGLTQWNSLTGTLVWGLFLCFPSFLRVCVCVCVCVCFPSLHYARLTCLQSQISKAPCWKEIVLPCEKLLFFQVLCDDDLPAERQRLFQGLFAGREEFVSHPGARRLVLLRLGLLRGLGLLRRQLCRLLLLSREAPPAGQPRLLLLLRGQQPEFRVLELRLLRRMLSPRLPHTWARAAPTPCLRPSIPCSPAGQGLRACPLKDNCSSVFRHPPCTQPHKTPWPRPPRPLLCFFSLGSWKPWVGHWTLLSAGTCVCRCSKNAYRFDCLLKTCHNKTSTSWEHSLSYLLFHLCIYYHVLLLHFLTQLWLGTFVKGGKLKISLESLNTSGFLVLNRDSRTHIMEPDSILKALWDMHHPTQWGRCYYTHFTEEKLRLRTLLKVIQLVHDGKSQGLCY